MTFVSPVTVLTTVRTVVPSGETTLPVVVYCIPGLSLTHSLSRSGFAGNAERLNLSAEPGPHSSWEPAAAGAAAAAGPAAAAAAVSDPTTNNSAEPYAVN